MIYASVSSPFDRCDVTPLIWYGICVAQIVMDNEDSEVVEGSHNRGPIDRSGTPNAGATVNDLPPDVLLLIFAELRRAIQETPKWNIYTLGSDDRQSSAWQPYGDPMPQPHFPEPIPSVCRYWRDVMSSVSSFWTRLVIWLGKEPTPLSSIRDYLAWSRDNLLDIYVLYRSNSNPYLDPQWFTEEKAQVEAVMELLIPHMKRWKVFRMNVLSSSSLPLPRIDLVGQADELIELELRFTIDDYVASTQAAILVIAEFHTPRLDELAMGGIHLRECYVKPFPRYPMPASLGDLRISGYSSYHPPFHSRPCHMPCALRGIA